MFKVLKGHKALPGYRASRVFKAFLALLVLPACRAQTALQALAAHKV